MEDFVKRIVKEKEELDIKITNLENFMETDKYIKLEVAEKILMTAQIRAMINYTEILGKRIKYYTQ